MNYNGINLADIAQVRDAIRVIGMMVQELDIAGYLNAMTREETLGPILDPTAWMRADRETGKTLSECAVLLLKLQKVVTAHNDRVGIGDGNK